MPYQFSRIKTPGWDFYVAEPAMDDSHLVRFSQAGITPANRYQLLMFIDGPTDVTLDNPAMDHTMQAGQTSLDFPIEAFPQGCMWRERPGAPGARRMCLSPAVMRRWSRQVLEVPAGDSVEVGDLGVLLAGAAMVGGEAVGPGAWSRGGEMQAVTDCRILLASQS